MTTWWVHGHDPAFLTETGGGDESQPAETTAEAS